MRKKAKHLVGIVPAAGQPLDFKFFFNDNFIPIAKNYLAIERAIAECAVVGCSSIWVVLPKYVEPFLRSRIGDEIFFPDFKGIRRITIYYICLHPKDLDKKDSIPWSIIYGCEVVNKACLQFTPQLIPTNFYIAFPFGVFPLRKRIWLSAQKILKKGETRLILHSFDQYEGKDVDVLSGGMLGFSIFPDEVPKLKMKFIKQSTGLFRSQTTTEFPREMISLEERYSGRWMTTQDLLKGFPLDPIERLKVPVYAGIENWEKYRFYLSRKWAVYVKRSSCFYYKPRTLPTIGMPTTKEKNDIISS